MPVKAAQSAASERIVSTMNGWGMLIVNFALFVGAGFMLRMTGMVGPIHFAGALLTLVALILLRGYFTLQPNQARVLILFGAYKGTVHSSGFHWANPFYSRSRGVNSLKDSRPSAIAPATVVPADRACCPPSSRCARTTFPATP